MGIDVDHASEVIDLSRLETESLPLGSVAMKAASS